MTAERMADGLTLLAWSGRFGAWCLVDGFHPTGNREGDKGRRGFDDFGTFIMFAPNLGDKYAEINISHL